MQNTNNELASEYTKRAGSYEQLLGHLKKVNQTLQNASRLRVGLAKTKTIAYGRECVKKSNVVELVQGTQTGPPQGAGA